MLDTTLYAGVAAGSSGAVAAVVTTPIDVVKTRIMLAAGERKQALVVAREVLKEEGLRGLWRGGVLRAVWTMIGSGLYLGCTREARFGWEREGRRRTTI